MQPNPNQLPPPSGRPASSTLSACGQVALAVVEASQVGEARRTAMALATQAGFSETRSGELAIVVTELGTNLVRHGAGGELVLRLMRDGQSVGATSSSVESGKIGIEVLALDRGPGIADVGRALRDGYSSGSSAGTGLGAVGRLASSTDLFSAAGGTAMVARLWRDGRALQASKGLPDDGRGDGALALGVVSVPYPGETRCGDSWSVVEDLAHGRSLILVADGLGHGPNAAKAASMAVQTFQEHALRGDPAAIVAALHAALRTTRGAAVAVAEIDRRRAGLRFCGVGNIAAVLLSGVDGAGSPSKSLVSQNGTAGVEARRIQTFDYPWSATSNLVMHSDGLTSRWQLRDYPGLAMRQPSLIAGVLYRDHRRGRDDVTVLVARDGMRSPPRSMLANERSFDDTSGATATGTSTGNPTGTSPDA